MFAYSLDFPYRHNEITRPGSFTGLIETLSNTNLGLKPPIFQSLSDNFAIFHDLSKTIVREENQPALFLKEIRMGPRPSSHFPKRTCPMPFPRVLPFGKGSGCPWFLESNKEPGSAVCNHSTQKNPCLHSGLTKWKGVLHTKPSPRAYRSSSP